MLTCFASPASLPIAAHTRNACTRTLRRALTLALLLLAPGARPLFAQDVATLSLVPAGVTGGSTVTGTVTLVSAATANRPVTLGSSNTNVGSFSTLVIPQGQTQGQFTISTRAVTTQVSSAISARTTGNGASQTLTVYPPQMQAQNGFVISPNPVVGGQNTNAMILLDGPAPAGGLTIHITTNKGAFVARGSSELTTNIQMLPIDIIIPEGQQSASLILATAWADYTQSATVTATLGQQSLNATLTLLGANLRVTDVLGITGLRLHWDGVTTNGQFVLTRDGATIATLSNGTASYDDLFPNGFTSGQTYLYQLFDSSLPSAPCNQLSSEEVTPYAIPSRTTQAVDSRLDLRYSDNHYLDHCFGLTTYKGGLFAGMASDPSKVGRSFARFSIPVPQSAGSFFRTGGISAFCTGLQATSATTVSIGCQIIPENTWDFSRLVWTATNPDSFSAGTGGATTAISYDPANPVQQWVSWAMPDTLRSALATATSNNAPTPLTAAWAGANESQPGWAWFIKGDITAIGGGSNAVLIPTKGPNAAYVLAQAVPVAAYRISNGSGSSLYNIILNGLNPGDKAGVILTSDANGGRSGAVGGMIDGLHHVLGPYQDGFTESGTNTTYSWATCNGVTVPILAVNGTAPVGTGGPGGPPQPIFGGGAPN